MKRLALIALLAAAVVAVAFLASPMAFRGQSAKAQSAPPAPPMVVFGTVSGVAAGTQVFAVNATTGANCTGLGGVVSSGGSTRFVVQVISDAQVDGCGVQGQSMTVLLYFPPNSPATGGSLATITLTWSSGTLSSEQNVTPGAPLQVRARMPQVAKDGIQQ
jgi:hypothetical protein